MNLREQTINQAVKDFAGVQGQILAALRRVAVDVALVEEGLPRLLPDEAAEVDQAAARGELPYLDGGACPGCEG